MCKVIVKLTVGTNQDSYQKSEVEHAKTFMKKTRGQSQKVFGRPT